MGGLGLATLFAAWLVFLIRLIRVWRRRSDYYAVGIGAGVITGLISVGFHSFFDFSMHTPANPVTLAAVSAIGYKALHRSGRGGNERFFHRVRKIPLTPFRRIAAAAICLPLLAGALYLSGRHFLAEVHCPTEWNSTLNLNWTPSLADMEKAIALNPLNSLYHFKRATLLADLSAAGAGYREQYDQWAEAGIKTSLRLNPAPAFRWHALGLLYDNRQQDPAAYVNQWLPLADRCFDLALSWAPANETIVSRVAAYWVRRSRILPESEAAGAGMARGAAIEKFQDLFRRLLRIDPDRRQWAARQVWRYYPDEMLLLGIVPEGEEALSRSILEWAVFQDA